MKRIVKEIIDWRVVGNKVTVGAANYHSFTAQFEVMAIDNDEITLHYAEENLTVKCNHKGFFKLNGSIKCVRDQIDQITFEQAIKEWLDKPIVFNQAENKGPAYVCPLNGMDYFCVVHCTGVVRASFNVEKSLNTFLKEFDEFGLYQADSWDDLHLKVIPHLFSITKRKIEL